MGEVESVVGVWVARIAEAVGDERKRLIVQCPESLWDRVRAELLKAPRADGDTSERGYHHSTLEVRQ